MRPKTGCSIIATELGGARKINAAPGEALHNGDKLVLIGSLEAGERFFEIYPPG